MIPKKLLACNLASTKGQDQSYDFDIWFCS